MNTATVNALLRKVTLDSRVPAERWDLEIDSSPSMKIERFRSPCFSLPLAPCFLLWFSFHQTEHYDSSERFMAVLDLIKQLEQVQGRLEAKLAVSFPC